MLEAGADLVFSVERSRPRPRPPPRRARAGRHAVGALRAAAEYVADAARAAGLRVDEAVAFTPRWENGAPVNGTLFVLHKP